MEFTEDIFKIKFLKKIKNLQFLILGARAFVHTTKKNVAFVVYATPLDTSTEKDVQEVSLQYHDFKDVFEKKNADILLK